jgi:hypothetical protein
VPDEPVPDPAADEASDPADDGVSAPPRADQPEVASSDQDDTEENANDDEPVARPASLHPAKSDAPDSSDSDDASPPPQTGYRDLFGKPVLQKKKDASSDDPPADAANESSASSTSAPSSSASPSTSGDGGVATATAAPADTETGAKDLQQLAAVWSDFVRSVTGERIRVGSCLQHAAPVEVRNGIAHIAVPDAFHRRQLTDHETLLADHLSSVLDRAVDQFRFVVEENTSPDDRRETTPESDPYERMRTLRKQYPVIEMLFDDFGGELVW